MARPEGRVEDYLRDTFRLQGWIVYKCAWGGGAADRLLVSPRAFHLYVELKRPDKSTLDPAQLAWRDEMFKRIRLGNRENCVHIVGPINSRAGVDLLLEQYRDR